MSRAVTESILLSGTTPIPEIIYKQLIPVKYNYDELIASCLLHDVSKLVEMEIGENGPQKSNLGKVLQHGYYGAYYAQKFNLPLSIISNILTHTGFSKTLPSTPEAIIMFYADMADADMHHLESNIPLNIRHHK